MQHYHNNRINPVLWDAQGAKSIWLLYRWKGLFSTTRWNHNWPKADPLAIFKDGRKVELGATEKQLQLVSRAGLDPVASELNTSSPKPLGPFWLLMSKATLFLRKCPLTAVTLSFTSDVLSCFTSLGSHDALAEVALTIRTTDQVHFPRTIVLRRTHTDCLIVLHLTSGVIDTTGGITWCYKKVDNHCYYEFFLWHFKLSH